MLCGVTGPASSAAPARGLVCIAADRMRESANDVLPASFSGYETNAGAFACEIKLPSFTRKRETRDRGTTKNTYNSWYGQEIWSCRDSFNPTQPEARHGSHNALAQPRELPLMLMLSGLKVCPSLPSSPLLTSATFVQPSALVHA